MPKDQKAPTEGQKAPDGKAVLRLSRTRRILFHRAALGVRFRRSGAPTGRNKARCTGTIHLASGGCSEGKQEKHTHTPQCSNQYFKSRDAVRDAIVPDEAVALAPLVEGGWLREVKSAIEAAGS